MLSFSLGKNGDDIAQILKDDGISTQDITTVQGEIANYISNFKFLQAANAEEIATRLSRTKHVGDQAFTAYCEYLTTLDEAELIENQINIRNHMEMKAAEIMSLHKENTHKFIQQLYI